MSKNETIAEIDLLLKKCDNATLEAIRRVVRTLAEPGEKKKSKLRICDFITNLF